MVRSRWYSILILTLAVGCQQPKVNVSTKLVESTGMDRTVLPIREPAVPEISELDARNAKAPARFQVTAPEKAPNVVVLLLDDIGFGHSSAFGGPIHMPNLEVIVANNTETRANGVRINFMPWLRILE